MAYTNERMGMDDHCSSVQPDHEAMGERLFRITHDANWMSQRRTDEFQAGRKFRDAMDWIMWSEARKGEYSGAALRVQIRDGAKSRDCYYTQTRQYHITGGVVNATDKLNGDLVLRADGRLGWEDVIYRESYRSSPFFMDISRASQLGQALLHDNVGHNNSVPRAEHSPQQQNITGISSVSAQPSRDTSPGSWDVADYTSNTTQESDAWLDVKKFWDSTLPIPANEGDSEDNIWDWNVLIPLEYRPRRV